METRMNEHEKELLKNRVSLLESVEPEILLNHFPMFIDRQTLVKCLARYDIFKKILNVKGSIVECGVHRGGGLMLYANLCSIYEPFGFLREVVGFDTFEGFPDTHKNDDNHAKKGSFSDTSLETLERCIEFYDQNRPIGHIPKVKLVSGDACYTIPKYFQENSHSLVALLYLDFDLYEPTKIALETILPRMPKGAIIVFDQLNQKRWKGETQALLEVLDINKYKIKQDPAEPHISYIRL